MKPSILISCSCFARYKSTKEMAQRRLLQLCLMVKDNQNLPKEKHPKEKRWKVEVVMGMERVVEMEMGGGDGGEGGGDGGDGPHPEGEDEEKEEDEEEEKEKDPHLPATPAGEESSSEPEWRAKGYFADDIIQKRDFFPSPGIFFLICSVFRPLHLSCHFPSMLHAICGIWELEPFIFACYLPHFGAEPSMLNAIWSILALELFYFACYLPHLGAETFYLSCYLPHLRAGTFQFACYL